MIQQNTKYYLSTNLLKTLWLSCKWRLFLQFSMGSSAVKTEDQPFYLNTRFIGFEQNNTENILGVTAGDTSDCYRANRRQGGGVWR